MASVDAAMKPFLPSCCVVLVTEQTPGATTSVRHKPSYACIVSINTIYLGCVSHREFRRNASLLHTYLLRSICILRNSFKHPSCGVRANGVALVDLRHKPLYTRSSIILRSIPYPRAAIAPHFHR